MQAIETRYVGPGNVRGARIIATNPDGKRHVISYPYELSGEAVHRKAAEELRDKMGWSGELVGGATKRGYCFVFVDVDTPQIRRALASWQSKREG